jgi:hypothetical protein
VSEKRQPAPGRQQFLDWITASFAGHDVGGKAAVSSRAGRPTAGVKTIDAPE